MRVLFCLLLAGCFQRSSLEDSGVPGRDGGATGDGGAAGDGGCPEATDTSMATVVTDIDATLTASDNEFLTQIVDPTHDPEMRPDADTLMQAYHELGYRIVYVTARGEALSLSDGTTARDATSAWLHAHGFPVLSEDDIILAAGMGAAGADSATYKADALADLEAAGQALDYAYGNAATDVAAYQDAAIEDDHDFLVGDLAGSAADYGVVGISSEDAYTAHVADWMPSVPCAE